jgi:hypothetical protein
LVNRRLVPGLVLALLAGCGDRGTPRVDPADYNAFYLWAGVRPVPELARAQTLYLLAGEVRREDPDALVLLRPEPPRLPDQDVWLVVRAARLDSGEGTHQTIARTMAQWRARGTRLVGLQVDFDATTPGLGDYAGFLKALRQRLPNDYRLSVTGLMDWSANADPAHLAALQGTVDEVVVQSYQARTTIPGYAAYLDKLARVPVPHKVALIEHGEWREPPALKRDPLFRGYVVFLLPD